MEKGYLFVFEGPDGVGKTSLVDKVFDSIAIQGHPVSKLSFPGKELGSIGSLVYQIHHKPESFNLSKISPSSLQIMHIAAHSDAIENQITPLYKNKQVILLDRYWWSTLVYGKVAGINENILRSMIELELLFWQGIKPDVLFLLDRANPLKKDEDLSKWKEIKDGYSKLSVEEEGKYPIIKIINDKSIDFAQEQITSKISKIL